MQSEIAMIDWSADPGARQELRNADLGAPRVRTIPERVAALLEASSRSVAVVDSQRRLTYGELDRESTRLAAALRNAGAGPECCVGIFLERSSHFVVAALAILKSGAAYIPLDPATPRERVLSIVTDARVTALVTSSQSAAAFGLPTCPVIAIDDSPAYDVTPVPRVEIDVDSLAYVVYTSGSAGQPKGVEITHRNLCNLVDWHQTTFGVTSADRASQIAGLGFDAAGWELWPYLTAGATVYISDESTRRSPELLRDWLLEREITIAFAPTVLAEQLFRADWPAQTSLRFLLTGGDTLQHRPPTQLPFPVINNYGPTECTVVATSGLVSSAENEVARPSIGRPIANTTALILDEMLRPVSQGEPGELCIGGALVARGYRNKPELTTKRFVTYVTGAGEPLRIYRTGDRVRLLEDGEIDFLGRYDDQVKVRGYRIEPREIESSLSQAPGVATVAVSVTEDAVGGRALVAYVVSIAAAKVTESALREYLTSKLPDYMIPAFFVSLDALPVLPNGKLDKSALPPPSQDNLLPREASTNAATTQYSAVEEQIAGLVASLMSRQSIGRDENFFMAGGHSMFGVQLVARIRDTFGVRLTLRQLFKAPTIAALSVEVARLTKTAERAQA